MGQYRDLIDLRGKLYGQVNAETICNDPDCPAARRLVDFVRNTDAGLYEHVPNSIFDALQSEVGEYRDAYWNKEVVIRMMMRMLAGSIEAMVLEREPVDCIVDEIFKVPGLQDYAPGKYDRIEGAVRELLEAYDALSDDIDTYPELEDDIDAWPVLKSDELVDDGCDNLEQRLMEQLEGSQAELGPILIL